MASRTFTSRSFISDSFKVELFLFESSKNHFKTYIYFDLFVLKISNIVSHQCLLLDNYAFDYSKFIFEASLSCCNATGAY